MDMKILIELVFSLKKDVRSRAHELKLGKALCRLDIKKYFFTEDNK